MLKRLLKIQFVRQLLGAAGGMVVALVLYSVVGAAMPIVRALLPQEDAHAITTADREQHMQRIAERALQNIEHAQE